MNTDTHTQTDGPWKIEPFAFGWRIVGASGEEVAEIARSLNPDHKANARLIAAAPEMLEALQSLTHPMASDEDLQNALAVIAKAKGGKP
jgi:hypothetical protein